MPCGWSFQRKGKVSSYVKSGTSPRIILNNQNQVCVDQIIPEVE